MKKPKQKNIAITLLTFVFVVTIFSCKKDKKEDGNTDEEITKSERQIYEFLSPSGTGFSNGCPTIVDDYIYIGTSSNAPNQSNYFYKFDLALNKIWEYPLGSEQILGSPSLDSIGNIYFITDSARSGHISPSVKLKLYSLSNDGSFRWVKTISGTFIVQGMKCVAISQDDIIYAPGDSLYAFDIYGNRLWTYYDSFIGGGVHQAPIIDNLGNIYFLTYNKKLF